MPVQKFRTVEDAERALVAAGRDTDGLTLADRIARLWAFSAKLTPPLGFRGVRKYASLEEADDDRRRMTMARPGRHE
jgi:hypothetical protein